MSNFEVGEQPCKNFKPERGERGGQDLHECFGGCDGPAGSKWVSHCANCHTDHHEGGWDTCPEFGKRGIENV